MFLRHLIPLALTPVIVSAQCTGYYVDPSQPQCGVNYGDGTYLESNLIPADQGCPDAFGHNYEASATYTDLLGVVRSIGLATPVTSPADPAATVTFLYNVAYSNIKDSTPVTVDYNFPDQSYSATVPGFTVHNTIAYTVARSTVTKTAEETATSTSDVLSTDTTVVTDESTVTVTSATVSTYLDQVTETSTWTYRPCPRIRWAFTTIRVTMSLSCIPEEPIRKMRREEEGRALARRASTVFNGMTYAQLSCGFAAPATTTLTTATVFITLYTTTTTTETTTRTLVVSTSTSTVQETTVESATATVAVTPAPPTTTITVCTSAPRQTIYTTVTLTNTVHRFTAHRRCDPRPPAPCCPGLGIDAWIDPPRLYH